MATGGQAPWAERRFDNPLAVLHFLRTAQGAGAIGACSVATPLAPFAQEAPPVPSRLSADARGFAHAMLRVKAAERPSCDTQLRHAFIATQGVWDAATCASNPESPLTGAGDLETFTFNDPSPPTSCPASAAPSSTLTATMGCG
eukprot:gene798-38391_t